MKKIGCLIALLFCFLAFPSLSNAASGDTHIYLDGVELEQPEQAKAGVVNGSTVVPLRVIVESLGYEVEWDQSTKTITIVQGTNTLNLKVDHSEAVVNGTTVKLAAPPIIQNSVTLVPLRFVGEQTGLTVSWDNQTKSAYLTTSSDGSGGEVQPGMGNQPPENGSSEIVPPTTGTENSTPEQQVKSYIYGISFSGNRLMVSADPGVKPNVFLLSGPDRLVVDIPNAAFSDSFASLLPLDVSNNGAFAVADYPDVSQVRYSIFDQATSTIRIVVDLNHRVEYQMNIDGTDLFTVDLTAVSGYPATGSGRPLVVIDAGHGGSQPGAISLTKRQEKDFTLAVILKVEQLLKQETEFDFVLTRSTDVTMSLQDRVKIANDLNATLFVSVHGNSIEGKSNVTGSETYYTRDDSIPFANVMHKHLVAATGLTDRKVRYSSLHVTRETTMPAVLLEAGYLSNANDEAVMYTEAFQQRVAEGIVAGIKEYLGL
ncbi:N-acetylmuramoyl-L-alanine amidase family protein [Paenibacillus brevis]|uniref:N-acetylmuramoyl-L-alanine amidase family protein n=1 Tax=Paenibacillus brevis TaxID=2841508 RepID=A0ABS6FW07_9BACL|nr:N-acetylmuramoyl-L-alanine amidase family protein [Paenibacillus brevis]MBU5674412.1 N-acetylmuramoyl-L-alanine amidase family protein [Paenibacillus brevis]